MTAPAARSAGHGTGDQRAAVSNAVVRLLRENTGRGPGQARTFLQDDLVVVLLDDVLNVMEDRLVEGGEGASVLEQRQAMQGVMRLELVAAIEEILGRKVRVFMSTNHADPDIAAELFVLEPLPATV